MESEKLKEIEIMGVTEQGSDGAGPVFYNSRLSLYWWHLEKMYFVLRWIAVILNAEEGLSLSLCLISALREENEVGWVAASLKEPQGAIGVAEQGWASPAWTRQEPTLPLPPARPYASAWGEQRPKALLCASRRVLHGRISPRTGTLWHQLDTVKFLTQAVAQGVEGQNLSVPSCPWYREVEMLELILLSPIKLMSEE